MDIFKMANEIASNMSADERNSIENMDMDKMISHVTKNVFKMMSNLNDESAFPIASGNSGTSGTLSNVTRTKDIHFDLNVDLEDFYTGKKKKLNVKRKTTKQVNGKNVVVDEKIKIVIPIEKGMKDGTKIKFEGQADNIPGYTPGDIIINLIENEHPNFQRDNNNLVYMKSINVYELYDLSFNIAHLDSRIIKITKQKGESLELIESLRKVSGQGMPIHKTEKFGDLYIRFNTIIPKKLSAENMELLKNIFGTQTDSNEPPNDSITEYFLESINDSVDTDSDSAIESVESSESGEESGEESGDSVESVEDEED
jgi:DnaJ-class molecular chaperone